MALSWFECPTMQYYYPGCISQQWRYANKPPITPEPAIHSNRDGAIYRATGYYLFLIDTYVSMTIPLG